MCFSIDNNFSLYQNFGILPQNMGILPMFWYRDLATLTFFVVKKHIWKYRNEFFPPLLISGDYAWILRIIKFWKNHTFVAKSTPFFGQIVAKPTPILGQIEPKCVHIGPILVQYGHISNLHLGEPSKHEMSQIVENVQNFFDPPPPLG